MSQSSFRLSGLEDSGTTGGCSHIRPARTLGGGMMDRTTDRICEFCKSSFTVRYPSMPRIFCSGSCSMKHTASLRNYRGENNPKWRGGRISSKVDGRVYVYSPCHPLATKSGYVYEYRLAVEAKIGRLLTREEIVHHTNADPSQSDPSALVPITQAQHAALEVERRFRDPATGFRRGGVDFVKSQGKWRARGHKDSRSIHLGSFNNEGDARAAVQRFWSTRPVLEEIFKP